MPRSTSMVQISRRSASDSGKGFWVWDITTSNFQCQWARVGRRVGNLAARGDRNRADDVIAAHERHLVEEIGHGAGVVGNDADHLADPGFAVERVRSTVPCSLKDAITASGYSTMRPKP